MNFKLLCMCCATILFVRFMGCVQGGKWHHHHSRESSSSESYDHDCSDSGDAEPTEETDIESGTEATGNDSGTIGGDSKVSDGDGDEDLDNENSSAVTYRCVEGYCYHVMTSTTYPPKCPFKDVISFAEYNHVILNFLSTVLGIRYWIDVKRNEQYGYYEWLELGENYGNIFDQATYTGGDCVILSLGLTNTFNTENCENTNHGLCVHRLRETNKSFCDLYEKICETQSKCYCYANTLNFTCQKGCKNYNNSNCDLCEEKFEKYPEPSITLRYLPSRELIYVNVQHTLKLSYANGDKLIFCFTDVYSPSTSRIRYKYKSNEINLIQTCDDTAIYTITPRNLGPGTYWCEGFKYPDLKSVRSDVIMAGDQRSYGSNFVLNLTLELSSKYTFLPYNIHVKTTKVIDELVNDNYFKSIRPVYLSRLFNGDSYVNISFHITTKANTDTSLAHSSLTDSVISLNSDELTVETLTSSETCSSTTSAVGGEILVWPEIRLGQVTPSTRVFLQDNGVPLKRSCAGNYHLGARWSEVTGTITTSEISELTQILSDLKASNKAASKLNEDLHEVISRYEEFIPYDIYLIALIFETIAQSGEPFDMVLYAENVDAIMEIDHEILELSQIELNATDIILYNFDIALVSSITNRENNHSVHNVTNVFTNNILAQVVNLKANNRIIGLAVYESDDEYIVTNITNGTLIENLNFDGLLFATLLPPNLLNQILEDLPDKEEINMVTAVFLNGALFNSKNKTKSHASLILSLYIQGFEAFFLKEPVPVILRPVQTVNSQRYCGFWNYGVDDLWVNIFGQWKVDDDAKYNDTYKLCNFTHLTHFALLVNGVEDTFLNVISIIGCVLSILGILGIFLTAFVSKSWREGPGTKILLNYSTAILIQMIVLLFSDLVSAERQRSLCIFTGMILHYTTISQFLWMLIISYLQYRKFVQVLVQEPSKLIVKSCLFAWVTPMLPLVIVASSDTRAYYAHDNCYLSGISLYLGLFLPIIAVISVNLIMFFLIFKSVLYQKTQAYGMNRRLISLKVKLAVILFFLMGFSWIFGLFAGFLKSLFLSYIFCLTATIQGLVMYLYFVVYNKNTRKLWSKKINQVREAFSSRSKLENEDSRSNASSQESKLKK